MNAIKILYILDEFGCYFILSSYCLKENGLVQFLNIKLFFKITVILLVLMQPWSQILT